METTPTRRMGSNTGTATRVETARAEGATKTEVATREAAIRAAATVTTVSRRV